MTIKVNGKTFDTVNEACERLSISRPTLLAYISEGFFLEPKRHKQGKNKMVRYFTEDWYRHAEQAMAEAAKGV